VTRFEGDRDFAQPPMDLFAKLTDARFLATCIPGVKSVTEEAAERAVLAGDKVPEIRCGDKVAGTFSVLHPWTSP
jgi:carbon monoxide dehydrogenase subunit G